MERGRSEGSWLQVSLGLGRFVLNENNRTKRLEKVNFISPYVELPKKLTVEENLKVY